MKKLVLILVVVLVGLCSADWDTIQVPQPAKDIIDALLPVPANVVKEFGNTEKVRLIHHLLALSSEVRRVTTDQEARIAELERQIAAMKPERQKVKIPELGIEGEFIPLNELPPEMRK